MPEPTPKMLPGEVIEQRVRCGRPNCRCARGESHQAFYRYWTEGGRQHKAYVRRADMEATRAACAKWKEADALTAAVINTPEGDRVRAQMRANLREALGAQIDTPSGRRQLRRLRSRCPGQKPDDTLERLAAGLRLELPNFRF
jgi:hypothetical protein